MTKATEYQSDAVFVKKYFILPKSEIAYLRFVLESYDGIAFVRTLDPAQALVEIAYPPSRQDDAEKLLETLQKETGMTATVIPAEGYEPI
jgi:hypothetical protein